MDETPASKSSGEPEAESASAEQQSAALSEEKETPAVAANTSQPGSQPRSQDTSLTQHVTTEDSQPGMSTVEVSSLAVRSVLF